ncbi:MAG: hypothetical protein JW751_19375 [Polyangiaceae bacterium]|nr:hypothetical protein [Polyangiaceae bacterium]
MKRSELSLRKELALAHLSIARTELTLARAEQHNSLAMVSSALALASSVLAQRGLGKWSRYARLALSIAQGMLGVTRAA